MTSALLHHIRRNVIAYIALFVALGGTSYAAFTLPANSVGTRQLRNHSVSPVKLGKTGAYVWGWIIVGPGGHVIASRPRGARVSWDSFEASGMISWPTRRHTAPWGCFPSAVSNNVVTAQTFPDVPPHGPKGERVQFASDTPSGQPDDQATVYLSVLCPQP
jgi:hypothetical protein